MRVALTIAGSDASAGAGIQADLKTFAALGVYGMSALTAVTSQNSSGVSDIFPLPSTIVRSQIESLARDLALSAVKIGMLASRENVLAVAGACAQFHFPHIVVDPVMTASKGNRRTLLDPDAVSILMERLLPAATIVTPNLAEAAELSGIPVRSRSAAREAARRIVDLGAKAVVVKGGHLEDAMAVDVLFDGRDFTEFSAPRDPGGPLHGTGCTFASAITAGLALGDDLAASVDRAKRYITGAIAHANSVGDGQRVLNHFWLY